MTKGLSEAQVEQYRRDGYLCPLTVLSAGQAAHYRAALEAAEAAAGGSLPGPYRHKPHLVYGWAQELIRQPAILDAVEGIIGPDILAWETVFFTKEPRTSDFISWHQDITYWGLDQEGDVVTAWLALSPSTPESGCMRVVPGTHKRDVVPHADTFGEHNMLSRGQEIAVEVDEDHAADLVLQPGQMSLHHVKIFHGSRQNASNDRRIGFAIRFLPPHVEQRVARRQRHPRARRGPLRPFRARAGAGARSGAGRRGLSPPSARPARRDSDARCRGIVAGRPHGWRHVSVVPAAGWAKPPLKS